MLWNLRRCWRHLSTQDWKVDLLIGFIIHFFLHYFCLCFFAASPFHVCKNSTPALSGSIATFKTNICLENLRQPNLFKRRSGVVDNMPACRQWFCRSGVKRSKLVDLPQGFWKPIQLLSGSSRSWRHPSLATWLISWTRSWTLRATRGWTRLPRGGGWAPTTTFSPSLLLL